MFVCVCAYFNFPIFSNMFCERFSSLDWKTTKNNVIILKRQHRCDNSISYQVDWFLEQEDNSKLERTTIEEQLSSESWSFVTRTQSLQVSSQSFGEVWSDANKNSWVNWQQQPGPGGQCSAGDLGWTSTLLYTRSMTDNYCLLPRRTRN